MRYLTAVGLLLALLLLVFVVAEESGLSVLSDPSSWLERGGPVAGAIGVGLLTADIVIPVPSSLIMVAHGAIFGPILGTVLSLVGGLGAALVGFALGRRGGPLLARFVSPAEQERAQRLLRQWGALALIVTRPVPLLAEAVVILAGTSTMGWGKMMAAAAAGLLPPALLYALAGAAGAAFQSTALIFVLAIVMAGVFWLVGRALDSAGGGLGQR